MAQQVNSEEDKNFVWTTGSWILKEALADSDTTSKEKLINASKNTENGEI